MKNLYTDKKIIGETQKRNGKTITPVITTNLYYDNGLYWASSQIENEIQWDGESYKSYSTMIFQNGHISANLERVGRMSAKATERNITELKNILPTLQERVMQNMGDKSIYFD